MPNFADAMSPVSAFAVRLKESIMKTKPKNYKEMFIATERILRGVIKVPKMLFNTEKKDNNTIKKYNNWSSKWIQ